MLARLDRNSWLFAALLLLCTAGALLLRLPKLDVTTLNARPMHGDEAVHTFRFEPLWQRGEYEYDPYEYHGPTLYYLTLPIVWLSGAQTFGETREWMYRLAPVLCGVALIPLLWLVRDGLGRTGAVCAGALTALSPAMAFYSRYYIQEIPLVLFTLGALAAGWRYLRTRRAGWALLAGACLGLMHATKETCAIAFGAMAAGLIGAWLWNRIAAPADSTLRESASLKQTSAARMKEKSSLPGGTDKPAFEPPTITGNPAAGLSVSRDAPNESASKKFKPTVIGSALLLGLLLSAASYSVLFRYPRGVVDSWKTYTTYLDRAGGHGSDGKHEHPWHYYLKMLLYTRHGRGPAWSEGFILALAAVGAAGAFSRRATTEPAERRTFMRFLVIYTALMTTAYSLIPYKTPWCMLGFLHGMILLAGGGAAAILRWVRETAWPRAGKAIWPVLAIPVVLYALWLGGIHLGRQAYLANFRFYADNRNPYVYAHPVTDVLHLTKMLEGVAQVHPHGHRMLVQIVASDPWPLPWYLRRFAHVGYWEQMPESLDVPVANAANALPPAVVIASAEFQAAVEAKLRGPYHSGYYGLRHGVALLVYVQQDTWDAYANRSQTD